MRYSYWKQLPKLFKLLLLTINFTVSIKDNKVNSQEAIRSSFDLGGHGVLEK